MCEDFALEQRTAARAVSYFDRYVSKVSDINRSEQGLRKKRVQLLAMTCVLIAAKFSEVKMPGLDDLCAVAQDKFSKGELKAMELETLRVLQWELHAVTPHDALQQLAVVINLSPEADKLLLDHAEFFVDTSYYEVRRAPGRPPPPSPSTRATYHGAHAAGLACPATLLCGSPPPHHHVHLSASAPSQYKTLPFPPLVIAASSLLCAWAHLGNVEPLTSHLPLLSAHCLASERDLTQCQRIIHDYFCKTFPRQAEAAEKRRQAALAANGPDRACSCSSPDTVMDAMQSLETVVE